MDWVIGVKTALITGVTGQDGAYLAKFLLEKGYNVIGTYRRLSTPNFWRLQHIGVIRKIKLMTFDLMDQSSMLHVIGKSKPDEIYNLAAQSFVGASFEQPVATGEITGLGVTRLLDTLRSINPKIKFYQASSSEMFGNSSKDPQNEDTVFNPRSPYAAAKVYAYWITRNYREAYNLFASNGILFNHESPLRGLEFVTRKITNAVARIKIGLQKELTLGNLDAMRDWGFAEDYVEAMWKIMQHDIPDDFVIATGETHSVREFADAAFSHVGLDYKKFVKTDQKFMRPAEVEFLLGDNAKAAKQLDWKPKVTFKELVGIMVDEDLARWKDYIGGKRFPWDAPSHVEWEVVEPIEYDVDR